MLDLFLFSDDRRNILNGVEGTLTLTVGKETDVMVAGKVEKSSSF